MKNHLRTWIGYTLLYLSRVATLLRIGYAAWLLFRWSLIAMPVDAEARHAVVDWWDAVGCMWGYCRGPKRRERSSGGTQGGDAS